MLQKFVVVLGSGIRLCAGTQNDHELLKHRLLETKKFMVVLGSGHVCGRLRVHFNVTSISLRFHFGFTSISLRVHFDSISISLRCHFDVTLISLRLEGKCLHGSATSLFRGNLDGRCHTYMETHGVLVTFSLASENCSPFFLFLKAKMSVCICIQKPISQNGIPCTD